MRKLIIGGVLTGTLFAAPVALAQAPTSQHQETYLRLYHEVAHKFGTRAPGRNIVRWGLVNRPATDQDVVNSLLVLRRMLAPPPAPAAPAPVVTATASSTTPAVSTQTTTANTTYSTTPATGLASCIIQRESGGNPQAVNGQYMGIAQMSQTIWDEYGGQQYASTPLGASASEQIAVLNAALAAGGASNWTPYDGC